MSKLAEFTVDESLNNLESPIIVKNQKKIWQSYIWDSLDKSPEERKFLFKLDVGLLTICCLGFFIKYLDQANLNNAFVSGMKEDLKMYGNQLNYVTTLWTVGYIIGEVPSNILLTRIRPSIWLSSLAIIWSVLTMCMSRCTNVTQLYALRFFIGLTESGYYPGVIYVIGSWYRKDEIAKRACIFNATGSVAVMFSGYLMSAVIGLDGKNGIKGWQWLFIMDGIISLPIALASFFLIPDFPDNTRVFYINESDKALAKSRMQLEGRKEKQPYTRAKVFKILTSWHIWLLPLILILGAALTGGGQPLFALWLKTSKHPKYSIAQINNYPTATAGVQVAAAIIYAWISDTILKGKRWPLLIWIVTINFILYVSLAVWDIPRGWHWACYILLGQGVALSPLSLVWANEICTDDSEERAIVTATMNDMVYVFTAWVPLLAWQQVSAPRYHKGFILASVSLPCCVIIIIIIQILHRRDTLREQKVEEVTEACHSKQAV